MVCGQLLAGDGVKELDRLVTAGARRPDILGPARNIEARGDILTKKLSMITDRII